MNKGQITIGIAWTALLTTTSVLGVYFTNQSLVTEKVNTVKTEIYQDISVNKQEIAALKEAVLTIKESQAEIRSDIKQILKLVK